MHFSESHDFNAVAKTSEMRFPDTCFSLDQKFNLRQYWSFNSTHYFIVFQQLTAHSSSNQVKKELSYAGPFFVNRWCRNSSVCETAAMLMLQIKTRGNSVLLGHYIQISALCNACTTKHTYKPHHWPPALNFPQVKSAGLMAARSLGQNAQCLAQTEQHAGSVLSTIKFSFTVASCSHD